jgi:hypothetical protein
MDLDLPERAGTRADH